MYLASERLFVLYSVYNTKYYIALDLDSRINVKFDLKKRPRKGSTVIEDSR